MTDRPWDLLVVGGGTAGIVTAKTAASLGSRVLLVERERTGGDCLWTGCVPSKSILAAAAAAADARRAGRFGVEVGQVDVDFTKVMAHVHSAIAEIEPVDSPQALEDAGVTVQSGDLIFTGPQSAEVDGRQVDFAQAAICTGSAPLQPPIAGLVDAAPLTSDTVWDLRSLPARLAVLGGGNIGCELGQAFARLGSQVTIVEGADRILGKEDVAAARIVEAALERDGVTVLSGSSATQVKSDGQEGHLVLEDGTHVEFDRLLVAVGRTPRTQGLGLSAAGVEVDGKGFVVVDKHLRTTSKHIWAVGDVTGHPQFTHVAGVHGSLAASNATLGLRRSVDTATVPRVTFTHPEVAAVGVGTERAAQSPDLQVVAYQHADVDRAVTESDFEGFTRIVVDKRGRILGATVVGPRAGETLGELTLAVKHGLRTRDLAGTTHAYPTYNDGPWNAAIADVRARLKTPTTARAIRILAAGRRRWVNRSVR